MSFRLDRVRDFIFAQQDAVYNHSKCGGENCLDRTAHALKEQAKEFIRLFHSGEALTPNQKSVLTIEQINEIEYLLLMPEHERMAIYTRYKNSWESRSRKLRTMAPV